MDDYGFFSDSAVSPLHVIEQCNALKRVPMQPLKSKTLNKPEGLQLQIKKKTNTFYLRNK